jgi:ribosomal protein S18 acetylase RimI-like enzyme
MTKVVQLPQLKIARLKPDQIDAAVAMLHEVWHATYAKRLPAHLVEQRTTEHFKRHLERRAETCWLAWMGPRLVGLSSTTSNCVDDVWVSGRYRRRGIATRLIDAACAHLARHGFRAAQAGCEDFNLAASAMFEHLGWRKVGAESVHIAPGIRHEAIVYTRPLPLKEAS